MKFFVLLILSTCVIAVRALPLEVNGNPLLPVDPSFPIRLHQIPEKREGFWADILHLRPADVISVGRRGLQFGGTNGIVTGAVADLANVKRDDVVADKFSASAGHVKRHDNALLISSLIADTIGASAGHEKRDDNALPTSSLVKDRLSEGAAYVKRDGDALYSSSTATDKFNADLATRDDGGKLSSAFPIEKSNAPLENRDDNDLFCSSFMVNKFPRDTELLSTAEAGAHGKRDDILTAKVADKTAGGVF